MISYIKYAFSRWLYWLGIFSTISSVVCLLPISLCDYLLISIVLGGIIISFMIPFIGAMFQRNFKLKTIGKSDVSFAFGDLFNEKCFVVTTNRFFDISPTGEQISDESLLGIFVNKYFRNNTSELENLIKAELSKLDTKPKKDKDNTPYWDYGTMVKVKHNDMLIYFLAFTDRLKTKQPEDFYIKTMQKFLKTIVDQNHGKTIAIPLLGDNNNLSNSGFDSSSTSFNSLIVMINNFGIHNQRSELKLKIIALPEKRIELIEVVQNCSK